MKLTVLGIFGIVAVLLSLWSFYVEGCLVWLPQCASHGTSFAGFIFLMLVGIGFPVVAVVLIEKRGRKRKRDQNKAIGNQ